MKQRIFYLDLIRVIAIFSMILLHVAGAEWDYTPINTYRWQVNNVYLASVRFCVPVFFMVSGCLFLNPDKIVNIKKLYTKNILRIVTAFVFWSFCYASLKILKVLAANEAITYDSIKRFLTGFFTGHFHMWFMFAIVAIYIAIPILRKITEDKKVEEYFLIAAFIFGLFIPLILKLPFMTVAGLMVNNMNLYLFSGYTFYFILGHYISNCQLSKKSRGIIYLTGILVTIFTITGTYFISLYNNIPDQVLYKYLTPNIAIQALAVFVYIKSVSEHVIFKVKFQEIIIRISKLSFGIYLVHSFVAILLDRLGITPLLFNPIFWIPILSIIIFIISLLIIMVINKIPVLNKYII